MYFVVGRDGENFPSGRPVLSPLSAYWFDPDIGDAVDQGDIVPARDRCSHHQPRQQARQSG